MPFFFLISPHSPHRPSNHAAQPIFPRAAVGTTAIDALLAETRTFLREEEARQALRDCIYEMPYDRLLEARDLYMRLSDTGKVLVYESCGKPSLHDDPSAWRLQRIQEVLEPLRFVLPRELGQERSTIVTRNTVDLDPHVPDKRCGDVVVRAVFLMRSEAHRVTRFLDCRIDGEEIVIAPDPHSQSLSTVVDCARMVVSAAPRSMVPREFSGTPWTSGYSFGERERHYEAQQRRPTGSMYRRALGELWRQRQTYEALRLATDPALARIQAGTREKLFDMTFAAEVGTAEFQRGIALPLLGRNDRAGDRNTPIGFASAPEGQCLSLGDETLWAVPDRRQRIRDELERALPHLLAIIRKSPPLLAGFDARREE